VIPVQVGRQNEIDVCHGAASPGESFPQAENGFAGRNHPADGTRQQRNNLRVHIGAHSGVDEKPRLLVLNEEGRHRHRDRKGAERALNDDGSRCRADRLGQHH